MVKDAFLQFTNGFGGPSAGVKNIHGLSRKAKVHRGHGELHAPPALNEHDRILLGDPEEIPELLFCGRVDTHKFGRPVAHLHDRHATAAPVEQFLTNAFKDRKRKRSRPRIEIKSALGSSFGKRGRIHDGKSSLIRNGSAARAENAANLAIQTIRNHRYVRIAACFPRKATRLKSPDCRGGIPQFISTSANSTRLRMGSMRSARTRTLSPRCHSTLLGFAPRLRRALRAPRPAPSARATMA